MKSTQKARKINGALVKEKTISSCHTPFLKLKSKKWRLLMAHTLVAIFQELNNFERISIMKLINPSWKNTICFQSMTDPWSSDSRDKNLPPVGDILSHSQYLRMMLTACLRRWALLRARIPLHHASIRIAAGASDKTQVTHHVTLNPTNSYTHA